MTLISACVLFSLHYQYAVVSGTREALEFVEWLRVSCGHWRMLTANGIRNTEQGSQCAFSWWSMGGTVLGIFWKNWPSWWAVWGSLVWVNRNHHERIKPLTGIWWSYLIGMWRWYTKRLRAENSSCLKLPPFFHADIAPSPPCSSRFSWFTPMSRKPEALAGNANTQFCCPTGDIPPTLCEPSTPSPF